MAQYVKFGRPPVVEVACGVRFDAGGKLTVAHLGAFWAMVKNAYPVAEEAAPIIRRPEVGPQAIAPRTWLITNDGSELIQLQKDWFLLNWKKSTDGQSYPSYGSVKSKFDEQFARFCAFLRGEHIQLSYREFELTYVNHISKANGLAELGGGALLVDHAFAVKDRFLPSPTAINWRTSYPLPKGYGHLTVAAQTGSVRATSEQVVRLDLQATGLPGESPEANMNDWFDVAHEWITRGFADITTPELHAIWGRTL